MALHEQTSNNQQRNHPISSNWFASNLYELAANLFGRSKAEDDVNEWCRGNYAEHFRLFNLRKFAIRYCQKINKSSMTEEFYLGLYKIYINRIGV